MAVRIAIALAIAATLSVPTVAHADCSLDRRIFPIPMWATSPNEGNTWGIMPVWMAVCPDDQRTHWLLAPSVSWNSIVHATGTARWFYYPDDDSTLTLLASGSTRHNYRALVEWQHLSAATWAWTHQAVARIDRSVFARFFGIGADTEASDETSYTLSRVLVNGRIGRNVGNHLNVGALLDVSYGRAESTGVGDLPLAPEMFPGVPGMAEPSTIFSGGIDLRYDDRKGGDFAERGTRVQLWGGFGLGVGGSPSFSRAGAQASTIIPELERVTGAARVYWAGVSSSSVPFYAQSTLGGSYLLRGFHEGRFVDRMAWTVELEQRIRIVQTHFYGVVTDWRIDPFVAVGQVYGAWSSIVSNPRLAGGIGLRAFVRPSVLGRVDLAYGGEGLKVYVELGYPY